MCMYINHKSYVYGIQFTIKCIWPINSAALLTLHLLDEHYTVLNNFANNTMQDLSKTCKTNPE